MDTRPACSKCGYAMYHNGNWWKCNHCGYIQWKAEQKESDMGDKTLYQTCNECGGAMQWNGNEWMCKSCNNVYYEGATKHDTGKLRMGLLPPRAIMEVAKVFTFGAGKYGDRNWEKGLDYERVYGAIQRHLHKFWSDELLDEETGLSHLAHAACGILFLLHFELNPDKYEQESEE